MESIPLPDFVVTLWIGSIILLVVCGAIIIRGNRGGEVSMLEATLTPFAMPVALSAFIALVVSGIGSLLLWVGKTPALFVALILTVAIMFGAFLMARSGEGETAHRH